MDTLFLNIVVVVVVIKISFYYQLLRSQLWCLQNALLGVGDQSPETAKIPDLIER